MKGMETDKIFARMSFVISRFFFIYFTVTEVKKIVRYPENFVIEIRCRGILLQIIMVSPGTHLVKMFGPLCKQTVNLKTDYNTLYYSVQELK